MRLEALRNHFDRHFDRGPVAAVIEDLPIDSALLRTVRDTLALSGAYPEHLPEIEFGVRRLFELVTELRRHLLPVLRDRLGVSGFASTRLRSSGDDRVYRGMLALTFPHNLNRLEELAENLASVVDVAVDAHYDCIPTVAITP